MFLKLGLATRISRTRAALGRETYVLQLRAMISMKANGSSLCRFLLGILSACNRARRKNVHAHRWNRGRTERQVSRVAARFFFGVRAPACDAYLYIYLGTAHKFIARLISANKPRAVLERTRAPTSFPI